MAISPILEQRDSRLILKILLESNKTIKELNDHLISSNQANISTATLYRRVKELYLAGYLEKLDDGSYTASENGTLAYNELFNNKKQIEFHNKSITDFVSELTGKDSYILQKIQQRPSYTSNLINEIAISPNDLLKIFDKLIQLQLIEVIEKPGKKPGRPKKMYYLTEDGKNILKQIEEIKQKLQRKV